jgi:hypothetical protein
MALGGTMKDDGEEWMAFMTVIIVGLIIFSFWVAGSH